MAKERRHTVEPAGICPERLCLCRRNTRRPPRNTLFVSPGLQACFSGHFLHPYSLLFLQSIFVVAGGVVGFRQTFETVEASETFCRAPQNIVDAGRRLLELDVANGIATLVHNTVVVTIGCNNVPLFAIVRGSRGHTLFSFKCVYEGCTAFMDVRVLRHADVIKWIVMGISHNHGFSTFPSRVPRNTLGAETRATIYDMAAEVEFERVESERQYF